MQLINLPHKVCEYTCPINGIEDQYEWKTGVRLPDRLLLFLNIGFTYIKQKRAPAPRMVFWGAGMGKPLYQFLSEIIGYQWTYSEGKGFKTAFQMAKDSIDRGVPAMLGLLDMYHLPYFKKFYHKVHIPQHYVLMVGYDEQKEVIYVQDNSRPEVQAVPYSDLKAAWNVHNPGQGIPNTLCLFEFNPQIATPLEIMRNGWRKRAQAVLNPPVSFAGIPGLHKFAREFPQWAEELEPSAYQESLRHLVMYTCSVVPLLPQRLLPFPLEQPDPHQATRDALSAQLERFAAEYDQPGWKKAAACFKASGQSIQQLTEAATSFLLDDAGALAQAPQMLAEIAAKEEEGFHHLL